ncbi:MAG TPA: hypothetical protein VJB09_01645 [Candidatus Paceibacterota bacterium]
MQSHIFKNIVTAFLVMLFVFSPVLEVKKASAQAGGGYPTTGSYSYGSGGTSGGLSGYIKGLAPAITQLPKCKKKIKGAIKSLFGNNKNVISKEASGTLGNSLKGTIDESQAEADAIQNYDKQANDKLKKQDAKLSRIDEATGSLDENSSCLDSIGKLIIDRMIQRITLATVEWIKTGNSGGPAFVQDPGRFLRDIAKEEVLTFGLQLNLNADCQAVFSGNVLGTTGSTNIDSTSDCLNPYGKSWFKYQAEAFNKKFNDNARYSLNELIAETTPQYTGASFRADFSAGGWNAWTALTTVPANNPVGFGILAETELSKRLAGTQKSTAEQVQDALKESNGFLGDYRCADPEGTTKDQHKAALESGQTDLACKRWEYVTPGRAVAEEALKISHFQENKLIRADTLNDAMAAIVDALIQRFSNELYEKGLAGFSDEGSDGGLILNAYAVDGGYGINQVEKDYPEYLQGSEWFNAHINFNIRTDLTQAIIDEQRVYVEKLQKQNKVLERVIQWTQILDYCIPGPSPKNYRGITDIDLFSDTEEIKLKFDLAELVLQFDPTGIFSGIGSAILAKDHEKEIKKIIATHLGLMFDIHIYGAFGYSAHEDGKNINQDQVLNKDDMVGLGRSILSSYKEVIHNTYFNGSKSAAPMPIVTNEARNEFERIDAYKSIIDDNDDKIGLMNAIIQRLGRIKETVEDLGPVPGPSDPNFADYENLLKPFLAEFGRLTSEMVTGDDVAKMHKMLQEVEDKETYIHDDLLTGPGGCEEEMTKLFIEDRPTYSKFYRRQPYGEPIPYLYGLNVGIKEKSIDAKNPTTGEFYYDPRNKTAWSEQAVKNWNPNDGFLYGSVYWNFWARPYDGGNAYSNDGKTPNPPNIAKIKQALAQSCPEFIDVVYFSYPGGGGRPADIGGLEPVGGGGVIPYGNNDCSVISRRLEKMIGVY